MKAFFTLAVFGFALASASAQTTHDSPVVKLDPALDALVSPDAKLERLATGFGFTGKDRNDPAFEEFPMIGSNGLALDLQGRLIIAT